MLKVIGGENYHFHFVYFLDYEKLLRFDVEEFEQSFLDFMHGRINPNFQKNFNGVSDISFVIYYGSWKV